LSEVLEYATEKKVRVFFHSAQFDFPKKVREVVKPVVWGTGVCPGRVISWQIYREKLDRFLSFFPHLAGIQITAADSAMSVLACSCDSCRNMDAVQRVAMLTKVTALVAAKYGKEVQMRTWQRLGALGKEGNPRAMFAGLPANVSLSLKNTDGDFKLPSGLDRSLIGAAEPARQIVEFDAWREYEGHNYFPCYMGDIWGPRLKFLKEKGVGRIGVRLMWDSNENPLFTCPWGNLVNLFVLLEFVRNPAADPDTILNAYVRKHYPSDAQKAAFALYKASAGLQRSLYYAGDSHVGSHSRLFDSLRDAQEEGESLAKAGFFTKAEDFARRRAELRAVYKNAAAAVAALGDSAPAPWAAALKKGALIEYLTATGITDQLEFAYWSKRGGMPDLAAFKKRVERNANAWQALDAESYGHMRGDEVMKLYLPKKPKEDKEKK
jgi:hypothetical protein